MDLALAQKNLNYKCADADNTPHDFDFPAKRKPEMPVRNAEVAIYVTVSPIGRLTSIPPIA
jgi:hypothetical protein